MAQTSAAAPAQGKPKKQKQSPYSGMSKALIRRETISAYFFLIPSLIFFVTFVVVPMFICVFYSFTEYGLGGVKGFAGLENYVKLFQDPIFHKGFLNTVLIVVVAVPTVTAFSLWVSSAIYKMHAIPRSFFRCVFYLPVVTGSVAITVVWKWILNPYNGILNQVTNNVGFDWLGNQRTALWFIIPHPLYHLHRPAHRALRGGPGQRGSVPHRGRPGGRRHQAPGVLEDQVAPDHAHHPLRAGHHHHLPVLRADPAADPKGAGAPLNSTMTIMYQVYDTAYRLNDLGYANAIGVVLAIIIAIFSAIQFKVAKTD